ncbi:pyridoxamine 5'-phosphate oxidase family protein [Haladaptatus pallidirubidus]|uniref:Pyridoxamine 5'-phosphate oxidase N-terminal domain-containing protein n=1 Tax=Haladaptatus pallidirubidus TaxID=1008152 RepID=A0AAV3UI12_9EURY|nr:pyridoxamine 5'-phosphate oxidase family protein [Haladaptatus pallidirubidus]
MSISPDAEEFIRDAKLMAHLATSIHDRPHVAPVWYTYDDGALFVLTGGKKLANIEQNPRVAISIEKNTDGDAEWMITLLGRATIHTESERINDAARKIFVKYLGSDKEAWPEYYRQSLTDEPPNTLIEIEIASATTMQF